MGARYHVESLSVLSATYRWMGGPDLPSGIGDAVFCQITQESVSVCSRVIECLVCKRTSTLSLKREGKLSFVLSDAYA